MFRLTSEFPRRGDQPRAIADLTTHLGEGRRHVVLRGVTGSGKTYTMANVIANLSRPGANITGMSALAAELSAKRLQLLNDLVPGKKLFAVLGNPDTPYTALALREIKTLP